MAVFKPAQHIPLSKALAAIGFPLDARSYFYDETLFVYRPYISTTEVNTYLLGNFRIGSFDIVINFGGSLSGGVITGGENKLYWYDIGFADADLKPKGGSTPAPQDLQSVTEIGATTDRALTITDFVGVDYSIDGLKIQIDPGDETGGFLRTKTGNVINGLFFSPDGTSLLFQELGEDASELSLNTQTGLVAGARLGSSRMQIAQAINGNEAITLDQFNELSSDNFEKISFTGATGIINIDMTMNNRQSKFPNPDIRAYNTTVVGSTTKHKQIAGIEPEIIEESGILDNINVGVILGDGYILLINN